MRKCFFGLVALALSSLAQAQSQKVGSWSYGELENGLGMYAGTSNASGGLFVQQCYFEDDACYWIMSSDITCEEKASYPALINSADGASHTELFCFKIGKQFRTAFTDFKLMTRKVNGEGILGVAVPMASGEFRVNRFDMTGGGAAVAAMNKRFSERAKNSTRSKTL